MKKGSGGGGGGSAAEKKKARHSSNSDIPPKKQAAKRDLFQLFAEKVRDHKDLESRWAVLHETRVEYFRGKDFVGFLRNHVELRNILESDRILEAEDIANALLKKNLLVRCDRVVKTVRPGKKKLSTWPAHLEIFPDQVFSDNDAFFAWTFAKRRPLWQTLLSFSWPVLTLAICLFPVYPHQCKLLILYSCASLLLLILSVLLLRGLLFGAGWIFLGKRIWFFPNILAEEATLKELFQFWPPKDEGERPKWTARLFFAVVSVLAILLLKHHAPDEAARARYQKRVSNIIDDVLEWSPRLALSGMMEKQSVVNDTEPNNNYSDGGKASPENVGSPQDTDGETVTEEYEVKETVGNSEEYIDENEIAVESGNAEDIDGEHQSSRNSENGIEVESGNAEDIDGWHRSSGNFEENIDQNETEVGSENTEDIDVEHQSSGNSEEDIDQKELEVESGNIEDMDGKHQSSHNL